MFTELRTETSVQDVVVYCKLCILVFPPVDAAVIPLDINFVNISEGYYQA